MAEEGLDPGGLARDLGQVQVVDVRTPEEWDAGHIDGAVHIPDDELGDRAGELDAARRLVTVCHTGARSARSAADLAARGFSVDNLAGGMQAWAEAGLPVVGADGGPGQVLPPPPAAPEEMQRFAADFVAVALAVQEHFGDCQPTEEEVLDFLRRRDQGGA